jgi:type IV pilus assembly protein PilV
MLSVASVFRRSRGATMIEVLVALFILSVGLLGVAAMQQIGLRNSHSAHLRSQATALTYEIADRMRANLFLARNGDYATPLDEASDELAPDCASATPAARVICDVWEWKTALETRLPAGRGAVELNPVGAGATRTVTITVAWDDTRDVDGDEITFVTETQL